METTDALSVISRRGVWIFHDERVDVVEYREGLKGVGGRLQSVISVDDEEAVCTDAMDARDVKVLRKVMAGTRVMEDAELNIALRIWFKQGFRDR